MTASNFRSAVSQIEIRSWMCSRYSLQTVWIQFLTSSGMPSCVNPTVRLSFSFWQALSHSAVLAHWIPLTTFLWQRCSPWKISVYMHYLYCHLCNMQLGQSLQSQARSVLAEGLWNGPVVPHQTTKLVRLHSSLFQNADTLHPGGPNRYGYPSICRCYQILLYTSLPISGSGFLIWLCMFAFIYPTADSEILTFVCYCLFFKHWPLGWLKIRDTLPAPSWKWESMEWQWFLLMHVGQSEWRLDAVIYK